MKLQLPDKEDTNQTRKVSMFMARNDFDEFDKENPFTKMSSNPAKLDRCVKHVRAKGGVDNPWAVCNASLK